MRKSEGKQGRAIKLSKGMDKSAKGDCTFDCKFPGAITEQRTDHLHKITECIRHKQTIPVLWALLQGAVVPWAPT